MQTILRSWFTGQAALRVLFPCSLLLREFSVVEKIHGWEEGCCSAANDGPQLVQPSNEKGRTPVALALWQRGDRTELNYSTRVFCPEPASV